ncbi:arginine--tRNA ligase [Paenibacillus segetis]|uniref:Arginine--tRNA ligase n=1 Tax=Paenibacillus segetis TaxID=1325360 RepID=A0ABQ1YEE5_9BACL|nr:arginine--tRNA ligase [Paenibacillus segetis]GGH21926.1 arginine--tRNA ligase [Paenibacillus segetis]
MQHYKKLIADEVSALIEDISTEDMMLMLEYPAKSEMGDISLPCFSLSKLLRKAPVQIAEQLKEQINITAVERMESVSGYLNFYINQEQFAKTVISDILNKGERYGSRDIGQGRTIVIDYSSPNIAKPFHVGHLRSTVIGNALYQIYSFLGYKCVGVNHLGDWGTQFGKLIVAYQRWGNAEDIERDAIDELFRLYVKFHQEVEKDSALDDEARAWFVKMEQGDSEALHLWNWFIDISMKEFQKIYDLLDVRFDSYAGESFYNDKMDPVIQQLKEQNLLEEDQGAWLVRLDSFNMAPALMLKKDGSSLYHTRDVTAAIYRQETYHFDKAIYVTDYSQNLHFQQWFKIIELMDYPWAKDLVHVPFGRVSLEGSGFSTRKGNVIKLEDLLQQAILKIKEIIEAKNPNLDNKEEIAKQVGVGAVIFNDLSGNRIKDIVFSWEEALSFEGETGPYVQYTHARACSVLRKAIDSAEGTLPRGQSNVDYDPALLHNETEFNLLKALSLFPETIELALVKLEPSLISRYLVDLAQAFNRFYHDSPILVEELALRNVRLALVQAVKITLQNGLRLIGLQAPEKI